MPEGEWCILGPEAWGGRCFESAILDCVRFRGASTSLGNDRREVVCRSCGECSFQGAAET